MKVVVVMVEVVAVLIVVGLVAVLLLLAVFVGCGCGCCVAVIISVWCLIGYPDQRLQQDERVPHVQTSTFTHWHSTNRLRPQPSPQSSNLRSQS